MGYFHLKFGSAEALGVADPIIQAEFGFRYEATPMPSISPCEPKD